MTMPAVPARTPIEAPGDVLESVALKEVAPHTLRGGGRYSELTRRMLLG